ncbi:MAG TPA: gliding motility-associated C-terminal domain-containing protein [Ferruginibacter sp.]|nr:gliding motility-associated C-terminal domain-containing protein [Ferruginibacter sp.]
MKKRILSVAGCLMFTVVCYCQKSGCADSSIRVKYVFGNTGVALFNNPDTSGTNIFTGELSQGGPTGIALLKTTWGDSMIWAKKVLMTGTSRNSFSFPDGSILCTGYFGVPPSTEILLCRITYTGNVMWAKHFKLSQNHSYYRNVSNGYFKNVHITNNAIYVNASLFYTPNQANNFYNVVMKIDHNGNLIWSTGLRKDLPVTVFDVDSPVFFSNEVIFATNVSEHSGSITTDTYTTLTRLNDIDGSLIGSNSYKVVPDATAKGTVSTSFNINPDNSVSLAGVIAENVFGTLLPGNNLFNSRIDNNLNSQRNYYYTNNLPLDPVEFYYSFNNLSQHSVLGQNFFNRHDKYFFTFGSNDQVIRSRKFVVPPANAGVFRTSITLDNKENVHFIYHYPQSGKQVSEYARISNFAPTSTVGCVGKDTNFLTTIPFAVTKNPFTWDHVASNIIVGADIPFTEDTAIVTKELICKVVSYCDSIKINGPSNVCINQPVRYTIGKNNGCFKNSDWKIDSDIANIINLEGDSAIIVSFKKAFNGYIRAELNNCVVKDSFFVTAIDPPNVKILNRDSVLCPGTTITLSTSPGFTNYLWQDGAATSFYTVSNAGIYKVSATSVCGIRSLDSLVVNLTDTSFNIIRAQTICRFDSAFINLPTDITNVTWQPSGSALLSGSTFMAFPKQNTEYLFKAQRYPNCDVVGVSMVNVKTCQQFVFMPNAFTPNGDGLNDVLKATLNRTPKFYQLNIFSRYGQKIFESRNPLIGWDGRYKGKHQNTGGYVWQITYQFTGGQVLVESGECLLIR